MRVLRFFGIWAILLAAAWGGTSQGAPAPQPPTSGDGIELRPGFTWRVDVPAVSVSTKPDGTSDVTIEGFRGRFRRPGVPDLATKTYRIALPDGVTPTLGVRVLSEDVLRRIRPRPVATVDVDVPAEDDGTSPEAARDGLRGNVRRVSRFEEDASIYGGRRAWPEAIATLGEVGVFRDQRYVEVQVTPVRLDPVVGGLRVARALELTVRFDGDTGRRAAPASDPRFEALYRDMFVNYAEAKSYRLAAVEDAAAPLALPLGGPVHKIKIRENKTVRITSATVAATPFASAPLSTWKLLDRGVEVPLDVRDVNTNDLLDGGDWVQFYGQALDDEPKAVLNTDNPGAIPDIFEARDFGDENVYMLTLEAGPRSRVATRAAAPTNVRPIPPDFEGVAKAETDNMWRPLGGNDPWYWSPTLVSNGTTTRTDLVALPGLASTTAPIRVVSVVRGITEATAVTPDHRTRVTLLSASLQTLATNDDDGSFDGRSIFTHDFTWPGAPGTASASVNVRLEARPITVGNHQVILDRIELRYRRLFQATGDALTFDWPDGDAEFVVSGLAGNAPEVWEITGRVAGGGVVNPVRLTGGTVSGAGPFSVKFRVDNDPGLADGTARRFVVFGAGGVAAPAGADFAADVVSDLRSNAIQADMIVIAHPSVLTGTCPQALDDLLAWHAANQGITSKVAFIGDVYDEFNDGLPGPVAIRRFLQWVMSTSPGEGWANPKPSYVLIVGDGSYDYKAGTTNGSFVPTQIMFKDDPSFGYYASESIMAAVVGSDAMPDLTIGRIPVRTAGECTDVLEKILGYQEAPLSGNWRKHALVVSDRGKDFSDAEAGEFEATNDSALAAMKRPPHTSRRLRYWTDYCLGTQAGCTLAKANLLRADIKAAINGTDGFSDGASIVQFVGHGNFDVWSDDAFFDNRAGVFDTDDLDNPASLPMLFVHNCLSGGFMSTAARTLGEDWLDKPDGGSVSVFAPSGLSNGYFGQDATNDIWGAFFGKAKERDLAIPVMGVYADLCGFGAIEPCQNYVLLGDPASRAAFPTVAAPTNVVATPANARVDLSWTASATPGAVYDVYRAQGSPTNAYAPAGTGVAGTAFSATNLTNATAYYFAVVARDPAGFESRWSHLNSDCAISGPDCLTATPLNPNAPPAITGVSVVDGQTGGKLIVSWTASGETDLKQYDVRWGTAPGSHPNVVNAQKFTSISLTGLTDGQTYYVVVTATNTSNLTSVPSAEVSAVPHFVRGLRSPKFVSGLILSKSGANAVLTWPAVTQDLYDTATTIARYEIYRGTTATFVPGPGNKVGESVTATFTDFGAITFANPSYHYLVRAVDASGNVGGLGNQLPNGVGTLVLAKSGTTPGNLVLSWPAVTTDFNGAALAIHHYEVYARATVFSAANLRDGLVPLLQSPTATSIELTPPAGPQYYSVIAVDARGNKSPF